MVNFGESLGEIARWWFCGGQGVVAGLDGDGAVAPCRTDEFLDAPTGLALNPMAYGHRGVFDTEVGFDGIAGAVVDRPGLQVVLGHREGLLDAPQLVIGIDDECRRLADVMAAHEVIGKYHALWHVERSFRMSKTDLQARPMFHRTRDAIEAHLTIVFTALAVAHCIQERTGLAIANVIKQLRPLPSAPASESVNSIVGKLRCLLVAGADIWIYPFSLGWKGCQRWI